MTIQQNACPSGEPSKGTAPDAGVQQITDWAGGYVSRHPLASLTTVGDQFVLGVRTIQYLIIDLLTGRFQWQEFIRQGAFMAGTVVLPTVLVALPIGVTLSIQFALLAGQVGATSLAGAASGLAVIRQAASLTAAILMAAAVGSAITADLGSRKMREETDAMEVMGCRWCADSSSPVRGRGDGRCRAHRCRLLRRFPGELSVQRVLPERRAGQLRGHLRRLRHDGDMIVALVKAVVFGAIVAVVSCQKGMSTKGGPTGVANSVNAAVVESILVLMVVNVAISQLYIMMFPRVGL